MIIENPEKTCALVVGIGSSELGPSWELPGARLAAQHFSTWLKGCKVTNIIELMDSQATGSGVVDSLHRLAGFEDCNTLVLFWAGHGCATPGEERYLLTADAKEHWKLAYNVDRIIEYVRVKYPAFVRQLMVFDACALPEIAIQESPLKVEAGSVYEHPDRYFAFACATGAESGYPDKNQPSEFSSKLLQLLSVQTAVLTDLLQKIEQEVPGSHAVHSRSGKAKRWNARLELHPEWDFAREARRIGAMISARRPDVRWFTRMPHLRRELELPADADFASIAEKLSRRDRLFSGPQTVAMLLEAGHGGGDDIHAAIQASALLSQFYADGVGLLNNLRYFGAPCYLIKTEWDDTRLMVSKAWFYSGYESDPERFFEPPTLAGFDETFDALRDHMYEHQAESTTMIQIVAPLRDLLDPPKSLKEEEEDCSIVFRWRDRIEGSGSFRKKRLKFLETIELTRERVASLKEFSTGYFNAAEREAFEAVDLPLLRQTLENEANLFLSSLQPFSGLTRLQGCECNLAELPTKAAFHRIPVKICEGRRRCAELAHLTIVWDDRDLPRKYQQPAGKAS